MLYAVAHPGDVGRLALIGPMPDGITTIYEPTWRRMIPSR